MHTEESQPYGQEDWSEANHLLPNDLPFQQDLGGAACMHAAACKTKSREQKRATPLSGVVGEDDKDIHEVRMVCRCG